MEAQLRKLWVRRKSLSKKADKHDRSDAPPVPQAPALEHNTNYEAHAYGPAPQIGTLPIKPSEWRRPNKSAGHVKAQSTGLQPSNSAMDKDVHSRSKSSGGRIKPILVGISRPTTAGSTQIAVAHAADAPVPRMSLQRPLTSQSVQTIKSTQTRRSNTSRRSVDIMSFISESRRQPEGYNEDIAARNLELQGIHTDNSQFAYIPNSRYQEEVASRNSFYRHQSSGSVLNPVPGSLRSNDLKKNSTSIHGANGVLDPILTVPTTATHHGYTHEYSGPPFGYASKALQNTAVTHHSRNASMTSKTSTPLPPIPQEVYSEDTGLSLPEPSTSLSKAQLQQKAGLEVGPDALRYPSMNTRDTLYWTSPRDSLNGGAIKVATRANQGRPLANGTLKEHGNQYGAVSNDSDLNGNLASIPSSKDTNRSYLAFPHNGDFPDRTVMDLTNEELDRSPALDYAESPVVGQATADVLLHSRAQVVGPDRYKYQYTPDRDSVSTGIHHSGELVSQQSSDTWSKMSLANQNRTYSGISDNSSQYAEQPLAFSRVTTVSATSPTARTQLPNHAYSLSKAGQNSRIVPGSAQTDSEGLGRYAPVSDALSPKTQGNIKGSSNKTVDFPHTPPHVNEKLQAFYVGTPPETQSGIGMTNRRPVEQTPQSLYASPENLNSNDFKNPSQAFGILTRDFAETPSRAQAPPQQALGQDPSNRPSQAERVQPTKDIRFQKQSNVVSGRGQRLAISSEPIYEGKQIDHVDTPQKELFASSFNEEEFARKQMQARLALARLQLSLEEMYDSPPGRPDSYAQKHVASQVLRNRSDENTIARPSPSKYSKAKGKMPAAPTAQAEEVAKAGASEKRVQSFYSAVTSSSPSSHMSNSTGSGQESGGPSAVTPPFLRSQYHQQPAHQPVLPPATRAAMYNAASLTPVSPSEVSLSSFPMPTTSDPASPPRNNNNISTTRQSLDEQPSTRPATSRMHSSKASVHSIANSMASVYSIPRHMVPGRSSSLRDSFDIEDADGLEEW